MNDPHSNLVTVKPEWIDHNGHMNVAYYVLAFDLATDAVYEHWGLGLRYPERENCSIFTLGMNVDYYQETFVGDELKIATQLMDYDKKRIHYVHNMYRKNDQLCASNECLAMNVSLDTRRSAPFPNSVFSKLETVYRQHQSLPKPKSFQRKLHIRRN